MSSLRRITLCIRAAALCLRAVMMPFCRRVVLSSIFLMSKCRNICVASYRRTIARVAPFCRCVIMLSHYPLLLSHRAVMLSRHPFMTARWQNAMAKRGNGRHDGTMQWQKGATRRHNAMTKRGKAMGRHRHNAIEKGAT